MAKAAAPYVHPKLATVENRHGTTKENPLKLLLQHDARVAQRNGNVMSREAG
jgi:hypothetical protein